MLTPQTMPKPRSRPSVKTLPRWAEALRARRVQIGLSQPDVEERTQELVSQRTVSALENADTPLLGMAIGRVVALARALDWSLAEMQRATGVDLGITEVSVVGEGSADVYPLTAALTPDDPGLPVDHEAVAPGGSRPFLLRADTDEMIGTGSASIRPDEYLHVDLDDTVPTEGQVYVIADQDGVHVRLYAMTRLGPVFRAENRAVYPEDIPATEARVIGRVYTVTSDRAPQLN